MFVMRLKFCGAKNLDLLSSLHHMQFETRKQVTKQLNQSNWLELQILSTEQSL